MDHDINNGFSSELFPVDSALSTVQTSSVNLQCDQVVNNCEAMLQSGDIGRLAEYLWSLPQSQLFRGQEAILRARAAVAFQREDYYDLYIVLQSHVFHSKHHPELQQLWYRAHYHQEEKDQGRPLNSVEQYRVQWMFPLPWTIWDGQKHSQLFNESAYKVLKESYCHNRYPTRAEKNKIAQQSGLTRDQVIHWFYRRRHRERTQQQPNAPCMMTLMSDASNSNELTSSEPLSLSTHSNPNTASVESALVTKDLLSQQQVELSEKSKSDNTPVESDPTDMYLGLPPSYSTHYHNEYESTLLHHVTLPKFSPPIVTKLTQS